MAQQMCTFESGVEASPRKSSPDHITDSDGTRKPLMGRRQTDEHPSRRAPGTSIAKVLGQGFADIFGQRQPIFPTGFTSNDKLSGIPIDVL